MNDSTGVGSREGGVLGGASPADRRVEALYAEWLELHRAGEGSDVAGFVGRQPEELRSRIEERIVEHQRLVEIFHKQDQDIVPGLVVDEDYELIAELGAGATAVVWEARQLSLDRRVAIKFLRLPLALLSDRAQERFHREGRILAGIRHPGLVSVHSLGTHGMVPYLVEELVEASQSLHEVILSLHEERQVGAVAEERHERHDRRVAAWILDIARALAVVHAKGILHRDVKPANILVGGDDRARIIDFGLAFMDDPHELTLSGEMLGTVLYMSPEQAGGGISDAVDVRSDLFSLGVSFYEALTFESPFREDSHARILEKIRTFDPPDPRTIRSRVPEELAAIVGQMIEKRPERRYQDMDAVARDLEAFLAGEPISAVVPGRLRLMRRWLARRPAVRRGLFLAIAVMIIGAAFQFWQGSMDELGSKDAAMISEWDRLLVNPRFDPHTTMEDFDTAFEDLLGGRPVSSKKRGEIAAEVIRRMIDDYIHERAGDCIDAVEDAGLGSDELTRLSARLLSRKWEHIEASVLLFKILEKVYPIATAKHPDRRPVIGDEDLELARDLILSCVRARSEDRLEDVRQGWGEPMVLLDRLEVIQEANIPEHHVERLETKFAKGVLLSHRSLFTAARDALKELHAEALKHTEIGEGGLASPIVLRIQHELAYAEMKVQEHGEGDFVACETWFEDALQRWEAKFGEDHLNTLVPRWRLGTAYLYMKGRREDALKLYREVIPGMREQFGENAPVTLQAETGMAVILMLVDGAPDLEAAELFESTYKRKEVLIGKYNYSTLISLRGWSQALINTGHELEGLRLYQEVLRGHPKREVFNTDERIDRLERPTLREDPDYLESLYFMGDYLAHDHLTFREVFDQQEIEFYLDEILEVNDNPRADPSRRWTGEAAVKICIGMKEIAADGWEETVRHTLRRVVSQFKHEVELAWGGGKSGSFVKLPPGRLVDQFVLLIPVLESWDPEFIQPHLERLREWSIEDKWSSKGGLESVRALDLLEKIQAYVDGVPSTFGERDEGMAPYVPRLREIMERLERK